ncbi:MAG: lamin tail domain-containing protein [Treponema sp.]|nr:lamin tail domain-containing protein [Treponema sp.]
MRKVKLILIACVVIAGILLSSCPEDGNGGTDTGKLLILQAYGTGPGGAAVNRSFVELYNSTKQPINLQGYTLWFSNGIRTDGGSPATVEPTEPDWYEIELTGSIPSMGSFLILGPERGSNWTGITIEESYADIYNENFLLFNRAFKVALIKGTAELDTDIQNPFDTDGEGKKIEGYVDMVGSRNAETDQILGFETAPARNSGSEAVRRKDLDDTDDNSVDFIAARYPNMTNEEKGVRRPRNSAAGAWDPFAAIPEPQPSDNTLLIFQLGAPNAGGTMSHSFIELYNAGDTEVNLASYSLQYAAARETRTNNAAFSEDDGPWAKIDLQGTIPPRHSFLILGNTVATAPAMILTDEDADLIAGFALHNRGAKVILLSNQIPIETVLTNPLQDNPFDIDGNGTRVEGYVDMVGGVNTAPQDAVYGFESSTASSLSGSRALRRTSIIDTDNNTADFSDIHYGNATEEEINLKRPRNLAFGAWDPVTGVQDE